MDVSPGDSGSITINNTALSRYPYEWAYTSGSELVIEAVAAGKRAATLTDQLLTFSRRHVVEPRGLTGSENPLTLIMDSSKEIEPVFRQIIMHSLTVSTDGNGSTTPTAGSYQYTEGDRIAVSAVPDEGWEFSGWTGNVAGSGTNIVVTMNSDKEVTANFTKKTGWILMGGITGGVLLASAGIFWVVKTR